MPACLFVLRPHASPSTLPHGRRRRRSPEGDRRLRLFPLPSGTRGKDQYHRKRQPHPLRPIVRAGDFLFPKTTKKAPLTLANQGLIGIRQRLILPGRVQPSTFSTGELNFCVRDGNRWNLSVIATGNCGYFVSLSRTLTTAHRMILQTVPISSQFSVSDLLSLACFACAPLAILIFSFQALNEAFDRLVSSSYTPYGASTDDLSTW